MSLLDLQELTGREKDGSCDFPIVLDGGKIKPEILFAVEQGEPQEYNSSFEERLDKAVKLYRRTYGKGILIVICALCVMLIILADLLLNDLLITGETPKIPLLIATPLLFIAIIAACIFRGSKLAQLKQIEHSFSRGNVTVRQYKIADKRMRVQSRNDANHFECFLELADFRVRVQRQIYDEFEIGDSLNAAVIPTDDEQYCFIVLSNM